ncbi:MAG: glutamine-hydrolyzing GMP synthase [Candidatus Shapirobacteria bacterium]|nr:glutamine-hydrolyzing GMP synthase [Candidatus Shapirobacteria bacterium]
MVAVLDFGSQYTHLITRRIRGLGVKAEIFDHNVSRKTLEKSSIEGIILSGGPSSVYKKNSPQIKKDILELNIPILGICYGCQLLVYSLKGLVKSGKTREYGEEIITIKKNDTIFQGLNRKEQVWFSHGDTVKKLPSGFKVLATTKNAPIAAYANLDKNIYGVQFHPEVVHTPKGNKILKNFLFRICHAKKTWKIDDIKNDLIKNLKNEIGDRKVILGVSGGVDSTVAAQLLYRAIKDNLYCVFIDTGLLRKNETNEVSGFFEKLGFGNFRKISAEDKFLSALKGIVDPEQKRKIFAKVYFQVFIDVVKKLEKKHQFHFLAQGTIYPDRVESGKTSKTSSLIKTHHNLSVPKKLGLQIIEPLKDLYKDEVRELGRSMGISEQLLGRHPFPGPGLAIRILGEITKDKIKILQEADAIFIEELKNYGYYHKVWQAFAALLPIKAVGVMGDERTYDFIVTLRAVTSRDAMTADWANLPNELLKKISSRIVNQVKGVNRVVYDISQKPPATIEYE